MGPGGAAVNHVAGQTKTTRANRCRCGDQPTLMANGGEATLSCPCGASKGPVPFSELDRLIYDWNHLQRRGE